MIITRTPYRVSLFGGGSDLPVWYEKHGGKVVSFSIDKYSYLTLRELPPFFKHKYRISYSKVEITSLVEEIQHPAVRAAFRKIAADMSLELHHHGDLPAQSGVGTSSAFAVGLINALSILRGENKSQLELAQMAIDLEQIDLMENVGSQDQIACAVGGLNYLEFGPGKNWSCTPFALTKTYTGMLESRMLLVYSGVPRISSDVSKGLIDNMDKSKSYILRTIELAEECHRILKQGENLDLIGEMLNESWHLKMMSNPLSTNDLLINFYEKGIRAGALGGKILGAGGGGFFMFWVPSPNLEAFKFAMKDYVIVPIQISNEGTTRIL
jgi:D-glycero-alpha-D-manno-heptose-7-phosphate kinase